jgi:phage terminase small subunit
MAKLTRKQAAFVKELVNNPKQSATQAIINTYGKPDKPVEYNTARAIASENLTKPSIKSELAKYSNKVEDTLYQAVTDWGTHERPRQREIALDAAKYIHDKVHGKSVQQIQATTKSVSIQINLSGGDIGPQEQA